MTKQKYICFIVVVLVIVAVIFVSGCTNKQSAEQLSQQSQQQTGVLKGVSLSPKSFEPAEFTDFFEKASHAGRIVSWAGDWNELSNTKNSGPVVVSSLAGTYNYIPMIEAQFFMQSTGQLIRPLDDATKESYKNSAAAFAEKYKPEYLGFGIEVNILYEKSPADFEDFVSFYNDVYDAVKEKSPNTKMFTVFQLEKLKGLNGGLFGGINDPNKTQWFLLESFPQSDIIAFTTYPSIVYTTPSEIPQDYYAEIKSHTTKPVAFTEIGWHSDASPSGWESSEEEQAEFISTFFDLTEGINAEFVIWSFMYDQNTIEPFKSMGLYDDNGNAKKAWSEWLQS